MQSKTSGKLRRGYCCSISRTIVQMANSRGFSAESFSPRRRISKRALKRSFEMRLRGEKLSASQTHFETLAEAEFLLIGKIRPVQIVVAVGIEQAVTDRKSTLLNSSHLGISY